MASKAFAAVAAGLSSNNLGRVIVGGPAIGDGEHVVTIQAIDTSAINDDKLVVTYANSEGATFTDRLFVMSSDKSEFSFGLRSLWSAVLLDRDAIAKLIKLAAVNEHALETLTGAKVKITVEPGKGVQSRSLSNGKFAGFDVDSGEQVTEEFPTLKDVADYCKANAIKRSYLQVRRVEKVNPEENVAAFWKAVEALESTHSVISVNF